MLKLGTGSIELRHATVVESTAAGTAGLLLGGSTLTAFGSVIADALGGGDDCSTAFGTIESDGYNFSGDDTCGFGAGPGDQPDGGDPDLEALDDNGGPTETRLPFPTSPLIGVVPSGACTVETIDQRAVVRPQGVGCGTGSVEVSSPGAVPDRANARSGEPVRIDVLANDLDPDDVLDPHTLKVVVKPEHGSARARKGAVAYRSKPHFVGEDRFTYRVCARPRRLGCGLADVLVTVTPR